MTGLVQRSGCRAVAATALAALLVACGTPVGVKRADPRTVSRLLTSNVLTTAELSATSENVLFQRDLVERFDDDPPGAIAALHQFITEGRSLPSDVFALAELCYAYAERSGDHDYHLAAAVYAHAFLFASNPARRPDPMNPRYRLAADLYNRGLAEGFAQGPKDAFVPRSGTFPMPFGTLEVDFDDATLAWGPRRLVDFVPVAELTIKGLPTRYRSPGLGAPLSARAEVADPQKGASDFLLPWARVPVTALLDIQHSEAQILTTGVRAQLRLVPAAAWTTTEIDGKTVPLEVETTSSLALSLAESPVWAEEIGRFFQRAGVISKETRLASLRPYEPGRVPIVLVHGTASSTGRWAQMINELMNDPRIGPRTTFWLFTYDTGSPILYSATLLRDAIANAVAALDPNGADPALRRMIVIGHSQGGLLTKLLTVDSGDLFWTRFSKKRLEDLRLDDESRGLLRRALFVTPSPWVQRVVFLATPQHGSYVAGNWLAHQVARLISLPADLLSLSSNVLRENREAMVNPSGRFATSVANMTPGNQFIRTLAPMPIAPGIAAHSIIAVQGDGPFEDGDDGVVEYRSAHIDGVESELVVRSPHSCQDNPHTIDEVRRIMLRHLDGTP